MALPAHQSNPPNPGRRRAWLPAELVPVVLSLAFALYNVAVRPSGFECSGGGRRFDGLLLGAFVLQPFILAIWAALGPGAFVVRFPVVLAGAMVAFVFGQYRLPDLMLYNDMSEPTPLVFAAIWYISTLLVFLVPLICLRYLLCWEIVCPMEGMAAARTRVQFGLKHALGAFAACAILFGLARFIWDIGDWSKTAFEWRLHLSEALQFTFVTFSLIPIPLIVWFTLSRRKALGMLFLLSFVACLVCSLFLVLFSIGPYRDAGVETWIFMQVGAAAAGVALTLLFRAAGYRVGREKSDLPSVPPLITSKEN